jgi:multidrug efflux system membrane fusion protein
VLGLLFYLWLSANRARSAAAQAAAQAAHQSVPVRATAAKLGDLKLYLDAIGTVTPFNTVTLKSRVDGQIDKVFFKEGQMVQAGDLLIQIDPRPYQVQLTEAQGQMARDKANLVNAQVLLERDKVLFTQNVIAKQDLDNQRASVGQYEGTVKNDQGIIDNANLQLTYSRIVSPISGRVGLRLVDPGNIIHATDTTGLLVIAQLQPIAVVFSIPEDDLPKVTSAIKNVAAITGQAAAAAPDTLGGGLPVEVYDRSFKIKLASGTLLTLDNEIDQTTGTIKLKASFPNEDNSLFPNQFVNARLLVDTKHAATLVPAAAVQRSPQGSFLYVIMPNQTVAMRTVTVSAAQGDQVAIESGVKPGDLVVTDGLDKLRQGTKVAFQMAASTTPSTAPPIAPSVGQPDNSR